jgi:hypothetical protein
MAAVAQIQLEAPRLSAEDFETASIRSAAPSYVSEAPSYHSYTQTTDSAPAYTPREASTTTARRSRPQHATTPSAGASPFAIGGGLPRLPSPRRRNDTLQMSDFRIPTWSTTTSNPTYARVAHRRAAAATSSTATVETALRSVLDRGNPPAPTAEDSQRVRPLEDPYLVGEEAAAKARRLRLARENGDDILVREDRRWDFFLAEMKDWEERDRSWSNFRRDMECGNRRKLARYIGRR